MVLSRASLKITSTTYSSFFTVYPQVKLSLVSGVSAFATNENVLPRLFTLDQLKQQGSTEVQPHLPPLSSSPSILKPPGAFSIAISIITPDYLLTTILSLHHMERLILR